ncbi:MAG: ferrous iron transport protein B [Rubricoccaceae bacterium]
MIEARPINDLPVMIRPERVALAGNPNVGKTTVFNLLTGLRQKVANYAGVTVERKTGRLVGHPEVEIIDLPGTYSLNPKSLDERVAYDVLTGRMPGEAPPDVVVCVVDATNLERNLYVATQILDLGLPVVIALNMMDAAEEAGLAIDLNGLSERLGVPVVPLVARSKKGLDALIAALETTPTSPPAPAWELMPAVQSAVEELSRQLDAPELSERRRQFDALAALTSDPMLVPYASSDPDFHAAVLATRDELATRKVPYKQAETIARYGWLAPVADAVVSRRDDDHALTTSDKIDAVLTHRVWGPILFLAILGLMFQAVFTWAVPAMDLIEAGIALLSDGARSVLPVGWIQDLVADGIIAGVGNVVVFFPQILLLFLFLGIMEDTGYMTRVAFITDRLMRRLGLSGASIVPLLSAFACAIPAIMAARTLDNERDRIITIMVTPLMACSARLPVYTLFIAAFIPAGAFFGVIGYQGFAMFALYILGTVMAFVAAWVLKTFVFKGTPSSFVMELPPYRVPQWSQIVNRMRTRTTLFAVRAGKIILGASVILWVLAAFPRTDVSEIASSTPDTIQTDQGLPSDAQVGLAADPFDDDTSDEALELTTQDPEVAAASTQLRGSFIGIIGRTIEPVMRPLGFDWKISAGLLSAFAAREVIISTMATIYSVGDESDAPLRQALVNDRYPDGTRVYTPLVAVSLLVFFVFALQCMSTLAIAKRELNSWTWPAVMWLYMTGLAWIASFIVYQGGLALGLG